MSALLTIYALSGALFDTSHRRRSLHLNASFERTLAQLKVA